MPRLRNTIITEPSQLSEGDCLVYNGRLWDALGIYRDGWIEVIELGEMARYVIDFETIEHGQFIKISPQRFSELKSEQAEYEREHCDIDDLEGYRTGIFPCRD